MPPTVPGAQFDAQRDSIAIDVQADAAARVSATHPNKKMHLFTKLVLGAALLALVSLSAVAASIYGDNADATDTSACVLTNSDYAVVYGVGFVLSFASESNRRHTFFHFQNGGLSQIFCKRRSVRLAIIMPIGLPMGLSIVLPVSLVFSLLADHSAIPSFCLSVCHCVYHSGVQSFSHSIIQSC